MKVVPSIKELESLIKIPTIEWPGRCHEIATAIANLDCVDGRAVYGHYLGFVSKDSKLFGNRNGLPFQRHGWVVMTDGKILDPTRWVFEDIDPYIFYSENTNGEYDEGGNKWRMANLGDCPKFDKKEKCLDLTITDESVIDEITLLLGVPATTKKASLNQMFWLANLSPEKIGDYCKRIYEWLNAVGLKALVPLDNWQKIMEVLA